MYDENKYPTMKIMKCNSCGHVFNSSLDGSACCPECDSADTSPYKAGLNSDSDNSDDYRE